MYCVGRCNKIDTLRRPKLVFPGLAGLMAVTPKVKGFKPTAENNPDKNTYCEGIKQLGCAFFTPIIKKLLETAVRHHSVYNAMGKVKLSEDMEDIKCYDGYRAYLLDHCPEILQWKECAEDSNKADDALSKFPLLKWLKALEKTVAGVATEICGNGGVLALRSKLIFNHFNHFFGNKSDKENLKDLDAVVGALVQSAHATTTCLAIEWRV